MHELSWRALVRRTPLYRSLRATQRRLIDTTVYQERKRARTYREWLEDGRPVPAPPEVKQTIVRQLARDHGCRVLVETGTFLGAMLVVNRHQFRRLVSIELSEDLWMRASDRLRRVANVTLLHGDSAVLLPAVVAKLHEPALFWLDAHYSAGITTRGAVDTPIATEIRTVLDSPIAGHVVLIDDARDFGKGDYPSIEALRRLVAPRDLDVADDIIRFRT